MGNNKLSELEKELHACVNDYNDNAEKIRQAVCDRNDARARHIDRSHKAASLSRKAIILAVYILCGLVAFVFYKTQLGLF